MNKITIYTDGSCYIKTRTGGVGVYIQLENGSESFISKGYSNTTISRMELRAIITALQHIIDKEKFQIEIISDSQYTINSINQKWVYNWEKQGFCDRKNSDLWKLFLKEYRKFNPKNIKFTHCRGHQGTLGNEIADLLCCYKSFEVYNEDLIEE